MMITVAALVVSNTQYAWAVAALILAWMVFLASLVAAVWGFAARNTPAAYRRRMLKLLHRLGGATLVWDAYEGGLIIGTYRNEDGTWELLKIGGLHLLDMAGNPVPLPTAWRVLEGRSYTKRDLAHEAREIAQHYSTEPGHYVLALPTGTVVSTPAQFVHAWPEPTAWMDKWMDKRRQLAALALIAALLWAVSGAPFGGPRKKIAWA
jgi:hypothetical protein